MSDFPNLANLSYVDRVNRAIDFMIEHMGEPLKLEDIARAACFSPYHFHRIFTAIAKETPHAFLKRARLDRAVFLLSNRSDVSLTEIALACGFSSSSDFSRSFRAHFGVAPRLFDVDRARSSRREEMQRKLHIDPVRVASAADPRDFQLNLVDLPARRVAYLRAHRPYEGTGVLEASERLLAWARPRRLEHGQWLGYQWDDPELVPMEKCRYDVGLEIPAEVELGEDISEALFPPMKVAELEIKGTVELELRALHWIYESWLPNSGFAPDHQPGFEVWNGLPFGHGLTHFELRIHIAVVDAAAPLSPV